ncbi:hypothetical protein B0H14DRAFT_3016137 [Mycena olivaceomarginata]|nr:hypothetical protein B0H14DRAFT_3016137 [Mycena olivaceomarginata]
MKTMKTATLNWDVVVSFCETEINRLLASDFEATDTKQIKDIACEFTGTNEDASPYKIEFKLELSAPLISFSETRTTAVCSLAAPIAGGYGKTSKKTLPIKKDVYTLHFKDLELASASGDDNSCTPPNQSFVFSRNQYPSDGFVVIDLNTSKSLTVDITTADVAADDHNNFIKAHSASLCRELKTKFRTDFLNVRYKIARVKSLPVPDGMVQLRPLSFRFAAYKPDGPAETVLSLFIQTRKEDTGEKNDLDHNGTPNGAQIFGTASIIFYKDMIFDSVMKPALAKQICDGQFKLINTIGNITLDVDTKKTLKRRKFEDPERFPRVHETKKTVSEINITLPPLILKFYSEDGSRICCSRTWKYEYAFNWSYDVIEPGCSVHQSGQVKATHELKNNVTSFESFLDDYSVKMECSVDAEMWAKVDLKPENLWFWEHIVDGSRLVPDWVKDFNMKLPGFTLDLGSFNFFLTTNLLLPSRSKAVIEVDKAIGLKIPGDLYIVGKVATS